jgi:NAD(P)-dependent dehydrogenase (short-subunit alcohol dehydrogenase family)
VNDASQPLTGQVAVVTGGSSGIGFAAARALRCAGAAVALWARDPDRLDRAADELRARPGPAVLTARCDVSRPDEVEAAAEQTVAELGRVDVGFVNAGAAFSAGILEISLEDWRRVHATNLDGALLTVQSLARRMVRQGEGGAFCVVSSIAARRGAPLSVAYASSKTALVGLVRSAAAALAPHGIRANTVLPGFIRTHTDDDPAREARDRVVAGKTPVGRLGETGDLAGVVTYLCDKRYAFHTGDVVTVDGGYLLD